MAAQGQLAAPGASIVNGANLPLFAMREPSISGCLWDLFSDPVEQEEHVADLVDWLVDEPEDSTGTQFNINDFGRHSEILTLTDLEALPSLPFFCQPLTSEPMSKATTPTSQPGSGPTDTLDIPRLPSFIPTLRRIASQQRVNSLGRLSSRSDLHRITSSQARETSKMIFRVTYMQHCCNCTAAPKECPIYGEYCDKGKRLLKEHAAGCRDPHCNNET
jgi:hypothetical protein